MPEDINNMPSKIKISDVVKSIRDERLFYVFVALSIVAISLLALLNNVSRLYTTEIPTNGGVYKEIVSDDMLSLTPMLASNASEKAISGLIYAPLLVNNSDNTKELILASDVKESQDGLEIVITISPDARFSDGDKVNPEDVIYTYELYSKYGSDDNIRNIISAVDISESPDNSSALIVKRKTNNNLIYQMFSVGIVKKSQFENLSESEIARDNINYDGIGAGAYKVSSYKKTDLGKISNIKLFENNYYYELNKTRPYIRSLEFSYNDNKSNIAATLNSSKNEYSYYTSDKSIIKMVNASGTNISSYEIPRVYALYINQSKSTLLNQKDFRAKVANGISRSKIIQEALGGYAAEAYNPLPFDKAVMLNDSSVMASATSTASSSITLATLNSEELLKVSQNIKDQLANSGINVEIKSYDKDELVGKVIASRDFEMLLFGAEISDTSMLYPLWHSSFRKPPGSNISGYLSTTLDKNLEAVIATTSPAEINRLYSEIKNEINTEYAWIPLYTTTISGFTPKQLIITKDHTYIQGLEGRLQYISKEYIKTEPLWRRLNTANSNKRSNIAEIIYNFIH